MSDNKNDKISVERYESNAESGLNDQQVKTRIEQKLTNKQKVKVGKSYLEIIFTDLFSFFNILLFFIAGLMIYAGHFIGLFFLVVLIPNIVITMYEDISARVLLGKLNLVNQPNVRIVRNSTEIDTKSDNIVLDDIIHLRANEQICADGTLLEGKLSVNESLLTGESLPVKKRPGDKIYAGSYTVSGDAKIRVDAVGKYCYIETIHEKANAFKRTASEIKSSMKILFAFIGVIVIVVAIAMCVVYGVQGKFSNETLIKAAIKESISGSMVAMIPSGMYLLTSAIFSLSVIKLSKKNAQIQDFYSVEMLSKINVLCVDKTGTITDGNLNVDELVVLNGAFSEDELASYIYTITKTTENNNKTAEALLNKYENATLLNTIAALPFSSETKRSAITLENKHTFIMGAAELMNLTNKERTLTILNDYASRGLRVLTLAHSLSPIKGEEITGEFEAIALIILSDHIKQDAPETFEWFNSNGVEIKVISGDNAISVGHIASEAGIPNADKCISLEGKTIEEVRELAKQYTVFGRVSPEQKEAIILSLKEENKKVAMTGDGVNDILALKRSDCSIAMANGSDAARNVSNIVLLDSNFHSLPNVVSEGRRLVNNLQRTCSLFLVKTMFAMFFSVAFLLASLFANDPSISYPFMTNHLYLWEIFGIGMSSFFICFEKNETKFKGNFLKNVLEVALPAGIVMIIAISTIYLFGIIKANGGYDFGIIDNKTLIGMSSVTFSILGLVILFRVCQPLNKYRGIVFGTATFIELAIMAAAIIVTYVTGTSKDTIILIPFEKMTEVSWFITFMVIIVSSGLYLLITYILKVLKGDIKDVNN